MLGRMSGTCQCLIRSVACSCAVDLTLASVSRYTSCSLSDVGSAGSRLSTSQQCELYLCIQLEMTVTTREGSLIQIQFLCCSIAVFSNKEQGIFLNQCVQFCVRCNAAVH